MKLCGLVPNSYIQGSVSHLYIYSHYRSTHVAIQPIVGISHRYMNVDNIGNEAAQFRF
jgi:hypothetical protein